MPSKASIYSAAAWSNEGRIEDENVARQGCLAYNTLVSFEWNNEKAVRNASKHGVSFRDAMSVCRDPLSWTLGDPDHSVGEHRLITVGMACTGQVLIAAHTDRAEKIRIISARRATVAERRHYEEGA